MSDRIAYQFGGFQNPRYTPTPDELFDELLAPGRLTEGELRVLLYIVRRTFGWKKDSDAISLSQLTDGIIRKDGTRLDWGAGVQRAAASRAVQGLERKGIILAARSHSAARGHETTTYQLRMADTPPSEGEDRKDTRVVSQRYQASPPKTLALESQRDPQETPVQETLIQPDDSNPTPPKNEKYAGPYSAYIAGIIKDHSTELGDPIHWPANVTQALRLWQATSLDEHTYVAQLHEARRLVRVYQGKQGTGTIAHKMAYYFTVLRDLTGQAAA